VHDELKILVALSPGDGRLNALVRRTCATREHFSEAEAFDPTLDVMRNASNKGAVSLAVDAPRVEHGTERYLIDADGQTVFA
jgi:hypothetical protein